MVNFTEEIRPKLVAQAPEVAVRQDLKLDMYIAKAFEYRELGKQYVSTGDLERAYIMLLRFANITMKTIPEHKHYKLDKYQRDRKQIKKYLENALDILEQITMKLEHKYVKLTMEQYLKMKQEEDAARERKAQDELDAKNNKSTQDHEVKKTEDKDSKAKPAASVAGDTTPLPASAPGAETNSNSIRAKEEDEDIALPPYIEPAPKKADASSTNQPPKPSS